MSGVPHTPVIDVHGHTGHWETAGMLGDAGRMLHAMDAAGIERACVFNIFHPDGTRANDVTAAFVAGHPDRFLGFAYVSPMMPERMVPELERALDLPGFVAIKVYPPYTTFPLDHEAWDPVWAFAARRRLLVLSHTDDGELSDPGRFAAAAQRFPEATFLAGHSGNVEPARSRAIEAARRLPNYYLETCSTYRQPGVIERLVREAGAEKVLFGSDQPLMDPRSQLGKILTAAIADDDKRLVVGGNAMRLLGL